MKIDFKIRNKDIISVVLFGSYCRGDFNKNSDLDIFVILAKKDKQTTHKIINYFKQYKLKLDIIFLSKTEFEKKIFNFNPQLISLFYEGEILYDIENYFYKNRNLFMGLYHNQKYEIRFRDKFYSIKKLLLRFGAY